MFMAILNDTYSEVKEEVENRKEDFQMLDFLKRGYNNVREVISERDKLLDIQTTVKLAADDGVVTFDEIRENLRKLNFSDAEIGNVQFLFISWQFCTLDGVLPKKITKNSSNFVYISIWRDFLQKIPNSNFEFFDVIDAL